MSNLLPRELKQRVHREFVLRVVSVALFVWSVSLFGSALLLTPSYILVSSKLELAESSLAAKGSAARDAFQTAKMDLEEAQKLADRLNEGSVEMPFTGMLGALEREAGQSILIQGIVMKRAADGTRTVELRGVAATRDDLAQFVERLKTNSNIASADVPFSDLAQAKDAAFTASITFKATP